MKAVLMDDYGGPEVLRLGEVPDPVAGPGEILVEIHAASVNAADWKVREGFRRDDVKLTFPISWGAISRAWCARWTPA